MFAARSSITVTGFMCFACTDILIRSQNTITTILLVLFADRLQVCKCKLSMCVPMSPLVATRWLERELGKLDPQDWCIRFLVIELVTCDENSSTQVGHNVNLHGTATA